MTRINAFRSMKEIDFLSWGKNASALVFAAVLIVCSVTVGCSSDKPKPLSSNNQIPVTQAQVPPITSPNMPATQPVSKPTPKKTVSRKPATVNYSDKTTGVTFEYPRRYAIETGSAATELLMSNPIPMNFVEPGGNALVAVELPETSFANTDFDSAFFNVSVNKSLTADQCDEFAVPQPKGVNATSKPAPSAEAASKPSADPASAAAPKSDTSSTTADLSPGTKLLVGDLELRATEAVSGEGMRQSDSKYFHVFQNGACYEFNLNVTTVASEQGVTKHVDRDQVFNRLEKILATVRITPVTAPEVTAEAPAPSTPETPAQ